MKFFNRQRLIILLLLIVITPLGFLTKFYSGPAENWMNNSLGGLLYEIFWCLIVAFIFTKLKPIKIALWVFVITCMLEILQLWNPSFLELVRNNFIGRTIKRRVYGCAALFNEGYCRRVIQRRGHSMDHFRYAASGPDPDNPF